MQLESEECSTSGTIGAGNACSSMSGRMLPRCPDIGEHMQTGREIASVWATYLGVSVAAVFSMHSRYFDGPSEHIAVSWNVMLAAFAQSSNVEKACVPYDQKERCDPT